MTTKKIEKKCKKVVKKVTRWERKHPVATTAAMGVTAIAAATRLVIEGVVCIRTIKDIRRNNNEDENNNNQSTPNNEDNKQNTDDDGNICRCDENNEQ